ncbi:hypothetical protein [Castellaniella sp. GW247-6E4]|uniref:hypothetical protein n=1 Tax=Castellaniella sp. GW247-6E4 TaxID=3140380 RepID=UPI003315A10B
MTATVYSQWRISPAPAGRRAATQVRRAPAVVRRRIPDRAMRLDEGLPVVGAGFARARRAARLHRLALAAADVCMVLAWAAMIPGLMWLGAVAGF